MPFTSAYCSVIHTGFFLFYRKMPAVLGVNVNAVEGTNCKTSELTYFLCGNWMTANSSVVRVDDRRDSASLALRQDQPWRWAARIIGWPNVRRLRSISSVRLT